MRAMMQVIARLLTFRAGGEEMPHLPRLLVVLLVATLALDAALSMALDDSGSSPLWIALRIAIGQGLLWLLLQGAGKAARFVQTSIALTLVAFVFSLISAPLLLVLWPVPQDPKQVTALQALLMLTLMPMMIWLMCLRASILRGATDFRWLTAFVIALALLVAEASITLSLMKMFASETSVSAP
jgi:hypothetical protein